ncbi:MAG: acetyl-CoA carboxylase biotin carboxyl carrier protein [bacterium]
MAEQDVPLSEDEVQQISRLIETLNASTFDYLQLEFGNLKVTLAKGGQALPPAAPGAAGTAPAAAPAQVPAAAAATAAVPAAAAPVPAAASAGARPDDGTVAIVSPMIGRFYSQSEPGAAPYVSVGSTVGPESTVGLVEAMKMFNAVHAGLAGVVTEICVQDAALVEYGQVLVRVKPS